MNNRFTHILVLIVSVLLPIFACYALTPEGYYKRTGTGGYGVNNETMECPNCGKIIYKTESHMCKRSGSSSSYSGGGSSSSTTVTESDIRAMEAKYPDMKINQTSYTPVDYNSVQYGENSSSNSNSGYYDGSSMGFSSGSHKKSNKFWRDIGGIMLFIAIVATVIYICKYLWRNFVKPRPRPLNAQRATSNGVQNNRQHVTPVRTGVKAPRGADTYATKLREASTTLIGKMKEYGDESKEAIEKFSNSDKVKKAKGKMQSAMNVASEKMQKGANTASERFKSKVMNYLADTTVNQTKQVSSIADEIKKLDALRKSGAITDSEYQKLKAKLLK